MGRPENEKKRLTTLVEVSHSLFATLNLKAALHRVLEILERDHGMVRSIVAMLNEGCGDLRIKAAHGLTPNARRKRYRLDEGIIGRAIQSEAGRDPPGQP